MRILVTNDDGIHAQGLWALAEGLNKRNEVIVVAPDREQSGVGTSISLHHPVRVNPMLPLVEGIKAYAVEGTPGDAVIVALGSLVEGKVDLLVSGINSGSNLGYDVFVSGTVGAAFQGYFRGIPSMAVSVAELKDIHYEPAIRLACFLSEKIGEGVLPKDILLNVNLPNLPWEKIKGIEATHLGRRSYEEMVKEDEDSRRGYYWLSRGRKVWQMDDGSDMWALKQDKISITPLHGDLTGHSTLTLLKRMESALFDDLDLGESFKASQ